MKQEKNSHYERLMDSTKSIDEHQKTLRYYQNKDAYRCDNTLFGQSGDV